jgi:ribosomal protein S18
MKKYIFDKKGKGFIFQIKESCPREICPNTSLVVYNIESIVNFPNREYYRFKSIRGVLHCKFKNPNLIKRFITNRVKWKSLDFIDTQNNKFIEMDFPDNETALLWFKLNY